MKRLIALFLTLTLVLTNFQGWNFLKELDLSKKFNLFQGIGESFAGSRVSYIGPGGYYYDIYYGVLSDNTAYIELCMPNGTGTYWMPEEINGHTVTRIYSYTFYVNQSYKFKGINIPKTVIDVSALAFMGCNKLENITVDSENQNYTSVDGVLFDKDMKKLIKYPQGKLDESYTIPEGVTEIGESAFSECSSLKSIEISKGVTKIGKKAFEGCSALSGIEIPEGVTEIGESAFEGCSALSGIEILEGIIEIDKYTFKGCTSLSNISLPKSLTTIKNNAFEGCSSLSGIEIPEGVTEIYVYTFKGCTSLDSIYIPKNIKNIGRDPHYSYVRNNESSIFEGCSNLNSINVDSENENYTSIDGVLFDKKKKVLLRYPQKKTDENYSIPEGVIRIDAYGFNGCSNLRIINIPKSLGLGYGIEVYVFDGCSNLNSINVSSEDQTYSSIDGVLFDKNKKKLILYPEGRVDKRYSILEGVTTIGESAFKGCSSLSNIEIPEGVTTIGGSAFKGCSSLSNIEIPKGVTEIESTTFYGCSSLESIKIPKTLTQIGESAFEGCSSLINVKIPSGVTNIESAAFRGCISLSNIEIPEGIISIQEYTFKGCKSLKSIIIPKSVKNIYYEAFEGCYGFTIYGYPGSYAETYAKNKGKTFKNISELYSSKSYSYDKDSEYKIFIKNQQGMPIKGAVVSFDNKSYTTDSSGWVSLDSETPTHGVLKITIDDYYPFEVQDYYKKLTGLDFIELKNYEQSPYKLNTVYYVPSGDDLENAFKVDLISGEKRINKGKIFKFSIECKTNDSNDTNIYKYELWQNENMIADSQDGYFKDLSVDSFEVGTGIKVKVYFEKDKYITTYLNLEILKDPKQKEATLNLGDKFTFTIPDDVFLLGGTECNLELPEVPIYFHYEGDTIRAGINVSPKLLETTEDFTNLKNIYSNYSGYLNKVGKQVKSINKEDLKSILGNIETIHDDYNAKVPGVPKNLKINLLGYGEGKMSSDGADYVSLNIMLKIEYKVFDKSYFKVFVLPVVSVPVPTTVNSSIKISGDAVVQGKYDFNESALMGDIKINTKPSFDLFGGVGYKKILSGGIYGNLALDTEISLGSTEDIPRGVNTIDLAGRAGIRGYLLYSQIEHDLFSKTINIFTRQKSSSKAILKSKAQEEEVDIYDYSNYELIDRSYLQNESSWLGNSSKQKSIAKYSTSTLSVDETSTSASSNNIYNLLTNTYPASSPNVVSSGDDTVMVFLKDDGDRNVYNMTKLMYSVYDKSTKSWSTPKQIDSNNTADYSPYLYSDGKDIYVIYQEASKEFDNVENIEDYTKSMQINVAKFDAESDEFKDITTFETEENTYNSQPKLSIINGIPTVVWVSNQDGDVFGLNNKNSIMYSQYENSKWTTPNDLKEGLNSVIDLNLGEINNKLYVAYAVDGDNDLSTYKDVDLYTMSIGGSSTKVSTGDITNLIFDKNPNTKSDSLIWYEDEKIFYTSDAINKSALVENVIGLSTEFKVIGNKIIYIKADQAINNDGKNQTTEAVSNIYSVSYENGQLTNPIQITNSSKYIRDMSVINVDGELLCAFINSDINITEGSVQEEANLAWAKIGTVNNISLDSVYYESAQIKPGQNLPMRLFISNKGEEALTNISVDISDTKGNSLFDKDLSTNIASQENGEVSIDLVVPDSITNKNYTIKISSPNDLDLSDNEYTFNLYATDIEVTSEQIISQNRNQAIIRVTNNSQIITYGTLKVYKENSEDKPCYTTGISDLYPGESQNIVLNLEEYFDEGKNIANLKIVAETPSYREDYNKTNNETILSINKPIKVTFESEGETFDEECFIGETVFDIEGIQTPTREGYTFVGWSTEDGNPDKIVNNTNCIVSQDQVYYAIWQSEDNITVAFDNEGEQITKSVAKGQKLEYVPTSPTKNGYTFVGWFKDVDDVTTEYKSGNTYTEDVTYTAKYAHVNMLGAQVKAVVDNKSGIRFGTRIYDDGDEIVEKGTLILPANLLAEGEALTLETPKVARSVSKVNYEINEEDNYVIYLGTIINIPNSQFDTNMTASSYVIYKDKAGNEYTVYSPYKNGSTTINKLLGIAK